MPNKKRPKNLNKKRKKLFSDCDRLYKEHLHSLIERSFNLLKEKEFIK